MLTGADAQVGAGHGRAREPDHRLGGVDAADGRTPRPREGEQLTAAASDVEQRRPGLDVRRRQHRLPRRSRHAGAVLGAHGRPRRPAPAVRPGHGGVHDAHSGATRRPFPRRSSDRTPGCAARRIRSTDRPMSDLSGTAGGLTSISDCHGSVTRRASRSPSDALLDRGSGRHRGTTSTARAPSAPVSGGPAGLRDRGARRLRWRRRARRRPAAPTPAAAAALRLPAGPVQMARSSSPWPPRRASPTPPTSSRRCAGPRTRRPRPGEDGQGRRPGQQHAEADRRRGPPDGRRAVRPRHLRPRRVKPHVLAAAKFLGCRFGEPTMYGVAGRGGMSDHPSGHAVDFMVDRATGDGSPTARCATAGRWASPT